MTFKCLKCNKNHKRYFKEDSVKSDEGIDKIYLILTKKVYLYEYMDIWERFNGTKLPTKEELYSNLNIKTIAYSDHKQTQNVSRNFERVSKGLGNYHGLYVQSDTLLLAYVFEKF